MIGMARHLRRHAYHRLPVVREVYIRLSEAPPERRTDVQAAIACVGPEARPTGRLRLLQTTEAARLQQEWRGECGTVWLNVPVVQVAEMPPRWIEAAPAPAGEASNGEGSS